MKNLIKGLGLIAFVTIMGFGVMVCDKDSPSEDSNDSNSNYLGNIIIITGIPAINNGCDASIDCANNPEENLIIWGSGKINNRTVTFELINEDNSTEWKGTGLFDLFIHIYVETTEDVMGYYTSYAYTDGKTLPSSPDLLPQFNIKGKVSTIGFDKFMLVRDDDWWDK